MFKKSRFTFVSIVALQHQNANEVITKKKFFLFNIIIYVGYKNVKKKINCFLPTYTLYKSGVLNLFSLKTTNFNSEKKQLNSQGDNHDFFNETSDGVCGICCSPHLTGKCGTRHFFRWVRAQGRSPHTPGILLIRGASGAGR